MKSQHFNLIEELFKIMWIDYQVMRTHGLEDHNALTLKNGSKIWHVNFEVEFHY